MLTSKKDWLFCLIFFSLIHRLQKNTFWDKIQQLGKDLVLSLIFSVFVESNNDGENGFSWEKWFWLQQGETWRTEHLEGFAVVSH